MPLSQSDREFLKQTFRNLEDEALEPWEELLRGMIDLFRHAGRFCQNSERLAIARRSLKDCHRFLARLGKAPNRHEHAGQF